MFPTSPTIGTTHIVGSSEYKWNGYAWDIVVPYIPANATVTNTEIVATSEQTVFNATYVPTFVDVLRNGMQLSSSDYTATNGTTVVLSVGATVGDLITVRAYDTFSVADTYTKAESDAILATKADSASLFTLAQAQATALCF